MGGISIRLVQASSAVRTGGQDGTKLSNDRLHTSGVFQIASRVAFRSCLRRCCSSVKLRDRRIGRGPALQPFAFTTATAHRQAQWLVYLENCCKHRVIR